MSNCFSFHTNDNSERHNIAVFSRASPVKDEIVQIVKLDLSRVFLPQCVYLIVMEEFSDNLRGLIEEHREHFYIDFEKILRDDQNKELSLNINLRKFSNRYLSREVKSIIAIDNRSSKELAKSLATSYEDIKIIQYSDLDCINISELESILVVASVITSGRKILAVSRKFLTSTV